MNTDTDTDTVAVIETEDVNEARRMKRTTRKHGTYAMYKAGHCHCPDCRRANTAYVKRMRSGRRKRLQSSEHGTANGYINAGCRCELCTAAATRRMTVYRMKKRIRREQDMLVAEKE